MQKTVVSFDIGGTNMRAATVSLNEGAAQILDRQHRATPNHLLAPETPARQRLQDMLDLICEYFQKAVSQHGNAALAIAVPGPIMGNGIVRALPTMWGVDGHSLCPLDLPALLTPRLPGVAIKIMNDVTAAGYRFTATEKDFALFTLGSGIGLKVFIDGHPQVGPSGYGGELTHMVFDPSPDAPMCDCGGRGHLGALASGRAWQRTVQAAEAQGLAPDLVKFTEPLARAIAMLHFSLGLERFILAGGLAEGLRETLLTAVLSNLPQQGWDVGQDWGAMLSLAPADDAHALIGGAYAFL